MTIVAQPLHTFKSDEQTFTAATVEGQTLVIANTRNEEHASEGRFLNLVTVIPLQEAIAMAKALLAAQQQAEDEAWLEELYQRHLDHKALVDDALESEIRF